MYADLALRLPSTSAHWAGEGFRTELTDWVTTVVGAPRAMEQVKNRPWSTVWRVSAESGVYFAKQNTPGQAFEAALLSELAALAPTRVVPLTAADPVRDLLLTPDQGPVLGEVSDTLDDAAAIELLRRVVREAAQLQRELTPHAGRLVAAGLVRLAPSDAVAYVEQRLDDFAALPEGDPRGLPAGQARRVRECLPHLKGEADQVGALGLPLTLIHNDLHNYNVFDVEGQLRFFDFGDAMLGEPLDALMIPLSGLAARLDCPITDPRVLAAAEPAFEVWSDLASVPDLRAALPAALRLARLARTESWIRCLATATDAELEEWGDAASYWLAAVAD